MTLDPTPKVGGSRVGGSWSMLSSPTVHQLWGAFWAWDAVDALWLQGACLRLGAKRFSGGGGLGGWYSWMHTPPSPWEGGSPWVLASTLGAGLLVESLHGSHIPWVWVLLFSAFLGPSGMGPGGLRFATYAGSM